MNTTEQWEEELADLERKTERGMWWVRLDRVREIFTSHHNQLLQTEEKKCNPLDHKPCHEVEECGCPKGFHDIPGPAQHICIDYTSYQTPQSQEEKLSCICQRCGKWFPCREDSPLVEPIDHLCEPPKEPSSTEEECKWCKEGSSTNHTHVREEPVKKPNSLPMSSEEIEKRLTFEKPIRVDNTFDSDEIPALEQVDYMSSNLIDEDVKEMFKGKGGYYSHEVPMMQLIKTMKELVKQYHEK